MEFTEKRFRDFLTELCRMSRALQNAFEAANGDTEELDTLLNQQKDAGDQWAARVEQSRQDLAAARDSFPKAADDLEEHAEEVEKDTLRRLAACRRELAALQAAEASIGDQERYAALGRNGRPVSLDIDRILRGDRILHGGINYAELAYNARYGLSFLKGSKEKETCVTCWQTCRAAEAALEAEIIRLRQQIYRRSGELGTELEGALQDAKAKTAAAWDRALDGLAQDGTHFGAVSLPLLNGSVAEAADRSFVRCAERQDQLTAAFLNKFPPEKMMEEYRKLLDAEPSSVRYVCRTEMPASVRIGTLSCALADLKLGEDAKYVLKRHYPFLYRGSRVTMPACANFDKTFNYLFHYETETERIAAIETAANLTARLFMMIPPKKVHFTFADPRGMGSSFAKFRRLVSEDDRTIEVINGQIWSKPRDIEARLDALTTHISTVTQRYLQGRYDSIYDYNRAAGQNAEHYEVLILMDYPQGMTDQSLRYLEQIVTSGPKCGVFTMIFRDEGQVGKLNERSLPLLENAEKSLRSFRYRGRSVRCDDLTVQQSPILWETFGDLKSRETEDQVFEALREGISGADKVVIGIDSIRRKPDRTRPAGNAASAAEPAVPTASAAERFRIPIGVKGANEIQYLTLGGASGAQHALIGGVTGSGKSSLIHTIVMQTLEQYSSEEVEIYLIDFKRGVEFKVYADYDLPAFRVVAIESEREFGYSVLQAIERETRIRAAKFKRSRGGRADTIEEYRGKNEEKMPRILVIMDEFQELFTDTGDEIGRESAALIERIVRQGRVFGVHLILSTQSYANVGGLSKGVYENMAVRIVLKCAKSDADLLLENGGEQVEQISINDPGRAIYNSEGGLKSYSTDFRVAYVDDDVQMQKLEMIEKRERKHRRLRQTRVLLADIENNRHSIFHRFTEYAPKDCRAGEIHVGEALKITGKLEMGFTRSEKSNLLAVGPDTEKARNITTFTMLSLAINDWVLHGGKKPERPIVYLMNFKPLHDEFFRDMPEELAKKLPRYIQSVPVSNEAAVKNVLTELCGAAESGPSADGRDRFLIIFGWQRAECLRKEEQQSIYGSFGFDGSFGGGQPSGASPKQMLDTILSRGPVNGVHTMLWQNDADQMYADYRGMIESFSQRIAFDLSADGYGNFVGDAKANQFGENAAVYYSPDADNLRFRPYQEPDPDWVDGICERLNGEKGEG